MEEVVSPCPGVLAPVVTPNAVQTVKIRNKQLVDGQIKGCSN